VAGVFRAAFGRVEPEFDVVEHRQALAPRLAALPERERRILLLRVFGNMTQSQIAAQVVLSQMHVSRNAVAQPGEEAMTRRAGAHTASPPSVI